MENLFVLLLVGTVHVHLHLLIRISPLTILLHLSFPIVFVHKDQHINSHLELEFHTNHLTVLQHSDDVENVHFYFVLERRISVTSCSDDISR
jgi:hypothetical protein